jgi:putative PIN family toxin of toxin-antitoxin system
VRVVFDTNVFVSALVFPGGRADDALQRVIDGKDALIVSKAIIDELLSVLARKFARDREELARVAIFVSSLAEIVDPDEALSVLPDQPDNRILECALAGSAEAVVTGDRAMLALEEFRGVRILSLAEYLA